MRVFCPGVFDVFHVGHLNYILRASQAGDYLIVGVQDDREVTQCKGVQPVIPLAERMAIIENLRCVNEVVSYRSAFQGPLLRGLGIDVLAIGEEYGHDPQFPLQQETLAYCEQHQVQVSRIPRTRHISSTQIRGRLRDFWRSRAEQAGALPAGVTVLGSYQGDQRKIQEETNREVALVVDAVDGAENKTLLDLGCGDGRQLVELSKSFGRVIGVDFAGELLDLARQRLASCGRSAELLEDDAIEFTTDAHVDAVLLSGLLPYIDDEQAERLLGNLKIHARRGAQLFVRTSIGVEGRIDVVNQFSNELNSYYTAFYRSDEEIVDVFRRHGWQVVKSLPLYQHRPDTGVWWYQFNSIAETGRQRLAA